METHEKLKEIQARADRYKDGDRELAVTIIRFDLPYLIKIIQDMSVSMDFLCSENRRLKSHSDFVNNRNIIEAETIMEDGNGSSKINEEAVA